MFEGSFRTSGRFPQRLLNVGISLFENDLHMTFEEGIVQLEIAGPQSEINNNFGVFLPTRPVIHSRMMGFILSISTIFSLACVSLKGSAHSPMLFTDSDNPLLFCQRPCSRFQLLYITIIFNKLAVLFSLLQCSFCDKCTATKSKLILFK